MFPIGIDPDHILNILQRPAVHARIKELTATFAGRKVLLGVDRLDYIKGAWYMCMYTVMIRRLFG